VTVSAGATSVIDVLRRCVVGDPSAVEAVEALAASGGVDELLARAAQHRVVEHVAATLRRAKGVDAETMESLLAWSSAETAHQLRIMEDLRWLGSVLDDAGVPWLTFKGPVVAHLIYRPAGLRSFRDLDVAIPAAAFPEGIDALERAGANLLDRNWKLIRRERRGQLHVGLPLGALADVHWHVLNRRGIRRAFAVSMEQVFARAREVDVDGVRCRTFDPVDTLLHLALHAALGGADRLSWLEDCRRAIEVDAPPWDAVVERAAVWRAGPAVAVTLRRARDVLGAPVPDRVLQALEPSAARRRIGIEIERRWPITEAHTERSPAVVWAQVAREGATGLAAGLVFRVGQPLVGVVHRLRGEPGLDRASSTGAVFQPSGDPGERGRYLRAVAGRDG
jgi:hypothetical protein